MARAERAGRTVLASSVQEHKPVLGRAGRGERKRERKRGREDAKNGTDVKSPSVPIFASRHLVVFYYDFGLRWLSLLSVDGGPLTDNVVLSSDQRVQVLKRAAFLGARSRTGPLRDDKTKKRKTM